MRSLAKALPAAAAIQVSYRRTVAPVVRAELARWRARAEAIEDARARSLALAKLSDEGSHAKAAAMLATLAPPAMRPDATKAIVGLEVLFDCLDGLSERPAVDPLKEGLRLFEPYVEAVSAPAGGSAAPKVDSPGPTVASAPPGGGEAARAYLAELAGAVRSALWRLPRADAVADVARAHASRAAEAQTRMHAAAQLGIPQVEQWARAEAIQAELDWRELLTGSASSVLVVHALIAAAADPATTPGQAPRIADAYQGACVTLTLLDGIVDFERDANDPDGRRPGYLDLYPDRDELARTLTGAARRAAARMAALRGGDRHLAILAGAVAYYGSAPGADTDFARAAIGPLQRELAPLSYAMLALMGARRWWRRSGRPRPVEPPIPAVDLAGPDTGPADRRRARGGRLASSGGYPHRVERAESGQEVCR